MNKYSKISYDSPSGIGFISLFLIVVFVVVFGLSSLFYKSIDYLSWGVLNTDGFEQYMVLNNFIIGVYFVLIGCIILSKSNDINFYKNFIYLTLLYVYSIVIYYLFYSMFLDSFNIFSWIDKLYSYFSVSILIMSLCYLSSIVRAYINYIDKRDRSD